MFVLLVTKNNVFRVVPGSIIFIVIRVDIFNGIFYLLVTNIVWKEIV